MSSIPDQELRSHMLSVAKKTKPQNRSSVVTNSMKILRMVHIKKKKKEILKKKKKINSEVGRKPKQEMWVYRKKHTMVGHSEEQDFTCREENTWQVGVGGPAGCKEQLG